MKQNDKVRQLKNVPTFEDDFENVYVTYFKPLYLFARSIAKSDDLAKDVVSDVFYNLWKSNTDLTQIKELKSYLFRAVKNEVIRAISNDPISYDQSDTEQYVQQIERVTPEELLLEQELVDVIDRAVSQLPDQCRLIFDMAKNKQLNYTEIANELGLSKSTIKTQMARAIAQIREAIVRHNRGGNAQKWSDASLAIGLMLLIDLSPEIYSLLINS